MIAALWNRLVGWLNATFMVPSSAQPLRAALLNTGELVLLDADLNAQVLSVQTTEMLRKVFDESAGVPLHVLNNTMHPRGAEELARFLRAWVDQPRQSPNGGAR